MVAARVIGNDATIAWAGASGIFELNVAIPVMGTALLESIRLLSQRRPGCSPTRLSTGCRPTSSAPRAFAESSPVDRHAAEPAHRLRGRSEDRQARRRQGHHRPRGRDRPRLRRARRGHPRAARRRPRRAVDDAPRLIPSSDAASLGGAASVVSRASRRHAAPPSDVCTATPARRCDACTIRTPDPWCIRRTVVQASPGRALRSYVLNNSGTGRRLHRLRRRHATPALQQQEWTACWIQPSLSPVSAASRAESTSTRSASLAALWRVPSPQDGSDGFELGSSPPRAHAPRCWMPPRTAARSPAERPCGCAGSGWSTRMPLCTCGWGGTAGSMRTRPVPAPATSSTARRGSASSMWRPR